MKEYLYLDTQLVNSLLAQLDQGIILKQAKSGSSAEATTAENTNAETVQGQTGLRAGVTASISSSTSTSEKEALVFSTSNTELIETALDDFSLDILIDRLKEVTKTSPSNDGEYVQFESELTIYNFNQLSASFNTIYLEKLFKEIFQDYQKTIKELNKMSSKDAIKHSDKIADLNKQLETSLPYMAYNMENLANYLNNLYSQCSLIRIGNTVSICENSKIRVPESMLSVLNFSKRKATLFGIAAAREHDTPDLTQLGNMSVDDILANSANVFMKLFSDNFNFVKKGDYYIRPIAIYFNL